MLAAIKRNTVADYAVMGVSLTGYSMPIFWWALLLILFFSVHLGWTPVSGRIAVQYDVPAVTGFMLIDTLRAGDLGAFRSRSEEHTSELQSHSELVCRLLLEKKQD